MVRLISMFVIAALLCQTAFAVDYEIEPNDSPAQAMPIALGQTVEGNVGAVSDIDDFSVVASTSSSLRILFSRPPTQYQYNIATLRVLNSVGTQLASVNAYAPDVFTSFDVGVTAGQTYVIEVTGCQQTDPVQDCPLHRSEPYELTVINLPPPTFEAEPNDTLAQANPIPPNAWVFAQHGAESDVDFFRVDLPSAGEFFVHLSRQPDPYLYVLSNVAILDSSGNLLNSGDVFAPNGQGRVLLGVDRATTLYVRVTSCSGNSQCDIVYSNPYQLVTGFRSSTPFDRIFEDGFD